MDRERVEEDFPHFEFEDIGHDNRHWNQRTIHCKSYPLKISQKFIAMFQNSALKGRSIRLEMASFGDLF